MKNSQAFLINRLAHKAKNDLTTMRLALFNLNHLLDTDNGDSQLKSRSKDFLKIIQTSLDQSTDTLSKILLATRSGDKYFRMVNLVQILFDVVLQHPAHDKLHIDIKQNEKQLKTDPESLQLFFELFFDFLAGTSDPLITIEFLDGDCLVFSGNFRDTDALGMLWGDENVFSSNKHPEPEFVLLRQLMRNLQISLDINHKTKEQLKIIMCFNQNGKG